MNKLLSIINNKFLIAFSFFLFLLPPGIARLEIVVSHFYVVRILLVILIILMLIKIIPIYIKNKRISNMTIVGIAYCFVRFITTYIKTNNLMTCIITYSLPLVGVILIFVETHVKDNTLNFIEGLLMYSEFTIYVNALCLLIKPFGELFFSGSILVGDNNHLVYYLLAFTSSYIFYYLKKDKASKYRMIVIWAVSTFFVLYSFSATAVVATAAMYFALLLGTKTKIGNIISYIVAYFAAFFGIVIFKVQYLFSFLIVDILHKDVTLTDREYVWRDFMAGIKNYPVLGHGYHDSYLYIPEQKKMLYAHNHILQEIYNGGIIAYLVYCWFVILPAAKLWKNRDSSISKVLSAIIFGIFFGSITESLSILIYILIYALSYNVESFISYIEK